MMIKAVNAWCRRPYVFDSATFKWYLIKSGHKMCDESCMEVSARKPVRQPCVDSAASALWARLPAAVSSDLRLGEASATVGKARRTATLVSFQEGPGTKLPTASSSQRLEEFRTNLRKSCCFLSTVPGQSTKLGPLGPPGPPGGSITSPKLKQVRFSPVTACKGSAPEGRCNHLCHLGWSMIWPSLTIWNTYGQF